MVKLSLFLIAISGNFYIKLRHYRAMISQYEDVYGVMKNIETIAMKQ